MALELFGKYKTEFRMSCGGQWTPITLTYKSEKIIIILKINKK